MRENFLYQKIYDDLRADIESGRLKTGERLPTEVQLSQQYQVSAITVKKALSLLTSEAFIVRVPGRGSFVADATEREQPEKLSSGAPPLIGLVLEHVTTPFGLDMLYTMEKQAAAAGCRLCAGFTYGDRAKETREIQDLLALGVRGLVIMPSHGKYYSTAILRLVVEEFPLVLVDKQLEGVPVDSVCTDNAAAMAALVRHLYDVDRRRIGLISTADVSTSSVAERRKGFFSQLEALGLESCGDCRINLDMRASTDNLSESTFRSTLEFLEANRGKMDSVICSEYGYLTHLVRAARQLGIEIPRQLAVCSVDEDYLAPGGYFFTHVKQDEAAIAEKALQLLLDRMKGVKKSARRYSVPAIFKAGSSTVVSGEKNDG